MIKLLTEDRLDDFISFCEKRITGAVIHTRLLTYSIYSNDVFFWYSLSEEGSVNGVFSMADGIFLACPGEDCDLAEAELFANTVGAAEISSGEAAFTMKFAGNSETFSAEDISGENIRDVFGVVFEDDENRNRYFEKWYTDASHKIRHNLIHGKCVYRDGKCVSVALTSGETDSIAVISSVATLKKYRNLGYGKQTVIALAQSLRKEVFLMTDNEKTMTWYEGMGFVEQ